MKTSRSLLSTFAVVLTAAAFACGGSDPQPPQTPSATPEASASATASSVASAEPAPKATETAPAASASAPPPADAQPEFDSLPHDKKVEVMMSKVVPNVGKTFKEHDAKKFDKFGCATCHGASKKEDPKKVLPKLTLSNGGFEKLSKAKPEVMKFMAEKVVPAMADALGEKPFDPATHKGFGCGGCHAVN